MELEQMRQLDAIARRGTISAAAEELHLSQPALSRSIKRLERELDQELFDRTHNSATLNDAGHLAVDHARNLLRDERMMLDAFADLARRQRTLLVGTVAPAPVWRPGPARLRTCSDPSAAVWAAPKTPRAAR